MLGLNERITGKLCKILSHLPSLSLDFQFAPLVIKSFTHLWLPWKSKSVLSKDSSCRTCNTEWDPTVHVDKHLALARKSGRNNHLTVLVI